MSKTALIVVDMLDAYNHPDAEKLIPSVERVLPTLKDLRHFDVRVPLDAVAHIHEDLAEAALKMMERNMSADVSPARDRG